MIGKKTVSAKWTKVGDASSHCRVKEVAVTLPVETATALDDMLLTLPWEAFNQDYLSVKLEQLFEAAPTDEEVVEAAKLEMAAVVQKQAQVEEKNFQKVVEALRKALSEEPEHSISCHDNWKQDILRGRQTSASEHGTVYYFHEWTLDVDNCLRYISEKETEMLGKRCQEWTEQSKEKALQKHLEDRARAEASMQKAKQTAANRDKWIRIWAEKHGSERLQSQLEHGFEGWPLYLHECLTHDFKDVTLEPELDSEAIGYYVVKSPTLEQLEALKSIKSALYFLGCPAERENASVSVRRYYGQDDIEEPIYCIVATGYRPGPADLFNDYTIRFDLS